MSSETKTSANRSAADKEEHSLTKTPLLFFVAVTFLLSFLGYAPWVLESYGLLPGGLGMPFMLIGGGSPTLGAFAAVYRMNGREGIGRLFGGFSRQFPKRWAAVGFLLPAGIFIGALALMSFVGLPLDLLSVELMLLLMLLPQALMMNVWEEIGWRGFLLPGLQEKQSAFTSSIIVGLIWSLWHIPHFLVKDSPQLAIFGNFLIFIFHTVLVSIVYTWLYNSGRGNLIPVTLFHATMNAV
ncbi:CPBP family intramembrane metalloprotease, partial [Candidatus Thorarchaeota archaeon]